MAIVPAPYPGETEATCTRWRVVTRNAKGKQEWSTVYGSHRKAEQVDEGLRVAVRKGEHVVKLKKETLGETLDEALGWIPTKRSKKRNKPTSASTVAGYREAASKVPNSLRRLPTKAVLGEDIEKHVIKPMADDGKSSDAIQRVLKHLKAIFNRARKRRVISVHPFDQYDFEIYGTTPKKAEHRVLSPDEVMRAADAATIPGRALILLRAFTGMRVSEVLGLRRQDIDLDQRVAIVRGSWDWKALDPLNGMRGMYIDTTKTGETRSVKLHQLVVDAVRAQLERSPSEFLFANRTKRPPDYSRMYRDIWKPALATAGVEMCAPNSLRHTFDSHGRSLGHNTYNVAKAMGHTDASKTGDRKYAHEVPEASARVFDDVGDLFAKASKKVRTKRAPRKPSNAPEARIH